MLGPAPAKLSEGQNTFLSLIRQMCRLTMRNKVFLMNDKEDKISCTICNEESGETRWITKKRAKGHLENEMHQKYLGLQTEHKNMKAMHQKARKNEASVQVILRDPILPVPEQMSHHGVDQNEPDNDEPMHSAPIDYNDIMDVYFGNDHRDMVFNAGTVEDKTQKELEQLVASMDDMGIFDDIDQVITKDFNATVSNVV
ncbi:hypothetical protein M422DRAFT_43624 [Sphaerobolus stellatus SS14]|nr:hypothetical protein M422DRAFT_43624 [Sphaerobolus stellatus SS14]